jgi:hypothetical protein
MSSTSAYSTTHGLKIFETMCLLNMHRIFISLSKQHSVTTTYIDLHILYYIYIYYKQSTDSLYWKIQECMEGCV